MSYEKLSFPEVTELLMLNFDLLWIETMLTIRLIPAPRCRVLLGQRLSRACAIPNQQSLVRFLCQSIPFLSWVPTKGPVSNLDMSCEFCRSALSA